MTNCEVTTPLVMMGLTRRTGTCVSDDGISVTNTVPEFLKFVVNVRDQGEFESRERAYEPFLN